MSRIDYSKWDHLEVSDDYEDDSAKEGGDGGVHVTRLDAPSKVTFGGGDSGHPKSQTKASVPPPTQSSLPHPAPMTPPITGLVKMEKESFLPSNWTEKGGQCQLENGMSLFWRQDRYTVTLCFELKQTEKKQWKCQLTGNVSSFQDRFVSVSQERARIKVWSMDEEILVNDEIPYPVHAEEDCADQGMLDWSIERLNGGSKSFLTVTLHKASPMAGLILWWKRPLAQCSEIELPPSDNPNAAGFQKAWNEAHDMFREKMKEKKKQSHDEEE